MRIIKKKAIEAQFTKYPDVEGPLKAWIDDVKEADWSNSQDVLNRFCNARTIPDNRVIFDIKGNKYRLVVHIFYPARMVYIKFFGTHAEYDKIDALEVDDFSDI